MPPATTAEQQALIVKLDTLQASNDFRQYIKGVVDSFFEDDPVLAKIYKDRPMESGITESGKLVAWNFETSIAEADHMSDRGYDVTVATPEDNVRQASMPVSVLKRSLSYSVLETNYNSDRSGQKLFDLVDQRLSSALRGMKTTIIKEFHGNGTTDVTGTAITLPVGASAPIYGHAFWVENTPTINYGGWTRSAATTYINNQALNVTTEAGLTVANISKLIGMCTHGVQHPNVGIMSDKAHRTIRNEAKAQGYNMTANKEMAELGYPNNFEIDGVTFVASKWLTDDAEGGKLTSNVTYVKVFDTKLGLQWRVHPTYNSWISKPDGVPSQPLVVQQTVITIAQLILTLTRSSGVMYWT